MTFDRVVISNELVKNRETSLFVMPVRTFYEVVIIAETMKAGVPFLLKRV